MHIAVKSPANTHLKKSKTTNSFIAYINVDNIYVSSWHHIRVWTCWCPWALQEWAQQRRQPAWQSARLSRSPPLLVVGSLDTCLLWQFERWPMLVISWVPLIRASPSFASRLIGVRLWLSKTYLDIMRDMEQVLTISYTWRPPIQWQGSTSVPPPSGREQGGKGGRGRHWHQPGFNHRLNRIQDAIYFSRASVPMNYSLFCWNAVSKGELQ